MKTECFIYCRVSSEHQAISGDGLRYQLDECLEYAKARDYFVVGVFSEASSGAEELPVRRQLERLAQKRRCRIVCHRVDRWTRVGAKDAPPMTVEWASDTERECLKQMSDLLKGKAA